MRRDERAIKTQRAVALALAEGPGTAAGIARRAGVSVGVARVYLGYMAAGCLAGSANWPALPRIWELTATGRKYVDEQESAIRRANSGGNSDVESQRQ